MCCPPALDAGYAVGLIVIFFSLQYRIMAPSALTASSMVGQHRVHEYGRLRRRPKQGSCKRRNIRPHTAGSMQRLPMAVFTTSLAFSQPAIVGIYHGFARVHVWRGSSLLCCTFRLMGTPCSLSPPPALISVEAKTASICSCP